jgi:hypothetical protein
VLELPHPFERQLYLIIRDDTIVRADPERKLIHAVFRERTLRLREARALSLGQLLDVPKVARERFLQLLQALPDTAGITKKCEAILLHCAASGSHSMTSALI